ncbi:MAG TPA: hypothetical protein VEB66_02545 [Opitutaceae bacterium]|nr:hypothetical protein [Opitutaceae bacterium]
MHALWIILPILLAIPAIYYLLTRRAVGGSGGDRADYTTDSPNDRPPPPQDNLDRAKNT